MKRLILLRHPQVELPAGTCYGSSDVPAASLPAAELRTLSAWLPRAALIVSSPLARCRTLAESLAPAASAARLDPRLQEMSFGEWELQRFEDIDRTAIDAWAAEPWAFRPPQGESALEMAARVEAALQEWIAVRADTLVLVTHGGPLRVIFGSLLRLPRAQWLGLPFDPASLSCLRLHADGVEIELQNRLPPYRL